jgi:hypothetical protein
MKTWIIISLVVLGVLLIVGLIMFKPQLSLFGINPAGQKRVVSASGELVSGNPNLPDVDYSSQKILVLQIIKQDGFEKLINIDITKINDTRFAVKYWLNESVLNDITAIRNGSLTLSSFRTKYLSDLSLINVTTSLNNFQSYPVTNLTINIIPNVKLINLSKEGIIYVNLLNYDTKNMTKSIGQEIKIGYNTVVMQTVDSTNDVGYGPSIALGSNGIVHAVSCDVTNKKWRYCNNSGGSWSCINMTPAMGCANSPTVTDQSSGIAVDSNGGLHVCVYNTTGTRLMYYNKTNGGIWTGKALNLAAAGGRYCSIAIGPNDERYISYWDGTNVKFANSTKTDTNWTTGVTVLGSSVGYPSIAVREDGRIGLSFISTSATYVLIYCNKTAVATAWACAPINAGTQNGGAYTSIVFDNKNFTWIAHTNPFVGNTMIVNNSNGVWGTQNISFGLNWLSLATSNGNVYLQAYNSTGGYLSFCNNSNNGIWACSNVVNATAIGFGFPSGRAFAIKLGRIVNSTSYSTGVHGVYYNNTDLIYWNNTISGEPPANTCTYTSGNYAVTCSDNCIYNSNVIGTNKASNITFNEVGRITLNANISNFTNYKITGGCNVSCKVGGCIRV